MKTEKEKWIDYKYPQRTNEIEKKNRFDASDSTEVNRCPRHQLIDCYLFKWLTIRQKPSFSLHCNQISCTINISFVQTTYRWTNRIKCVYRRFNNSFKFVGFISSNYFFVFCLTRAPRQFTCRQNDTSANLDVLFRRSSILRRFLSMPLSNTISLVEFLIVCA